MSKNKIKERNHKKKSTHKEKKKRNGKETISIKGQIHMGFKVA